MKPVRRILKMALTALTIVVLGIIQAAFFPHLRFMGCMPDLVMCFCAVLALRLRPDQAMALGLLAGLYVDAMYARYIGLYGLLFMYVCVGTSLLTATPAGEKKWFSFAVLPPLMLLYCIAESFGVRFVALCVSRGGKLYEYGYKAHFLARILPETLYNIVVVLIFDLILLLVLAARKPGPAIEYKRRGKRSAKYIGMEENGT